MIYKKILIAIGEDHSAENVAKTGLMLAKQLHAEIAVVSVANTSNLLTDGGITPDEMADIIRRDTRESQKKILNSVFGDVEVTHFVKEGKPHEAILKASEEWNADILVMGTHSNSGLSQVLLGSVFEKVIKTSTIPIFLVTIKE